MAKWTKKTSGGTWLGGGTTTDTCGAQTQKHLNTLFKSFIEKSCLNCVPTLRDALRKKWQTIEIECRGPNDCRGAEALISDNKLILCDTRPQEYELLRWLINACGGTELDRYAVIFHCYAETAHASVYPPDDPVTWRKFRDQTSELGGNKNLRVGTFVVWDSRAGSIWEKVKGASTWLGNEWAKGGNCFANRHEWRHIY